MTLWDDGDNNTDDEFFAGIGKVLFVLFLAMATITVIAQVFHFAE